MEWEAEKKRGICMNQKELRRRFRPEKHAIQRIYGCYVSGAGEILSDLDEPLGQMPEEEAEKYLILFKKALSGTIGKNLMDIVFSTQQVADSPEHQLLSRLRDTELKDGEVRRTFYEQVIAALDMEGRNYLILLAYDCYHGRPGGDKIFSYIVCVICPVKDGRLELGYFSGENEFHSSVMPQTVAVPEVGFLFPAFEEGKSNLYHALYYTRRSDGLHPELIDALFHTPPPMSAAQQQETFRMALQEGLGKACTLDVLQGVYTGLWERMEEHKQSRVVEPLEVTAREVGDMLQNCGVDPEGFLMRCRELFGSDAVLYPENLIDSRRFALKAGRATVWVEPEWTHVVKQRVIEGCPYLLVPVSGKMEVNGMVLESENGMV